MTLLIRDANVIFDVNRNRRATDDQAAPIERLGGAEAILRSDEFDFTPVPASRG